MFLVSGTYLILGCVLDSGRKCFGFWDVFLNSEKRYWIVGCVLDSGAVFGFWDMFCPYEPLHELDDLSQKRGL